MKRWVKNLICVIVIIAMLAAIDVTLFGTSAIALDNKVLVYEKDIPEGGGWAGSSNKGDSELPPVDNSQELSTNNQASNTDTPAIIKNISKKRLCAFAFECFVLAVVAGYLVISRLNKLSFKESFKTGKAKLYYAILVIVLTIVLFAGFYFILL